MTESTTPIETTTPRVRKNQASLTAEEKAAFVAAIKALKADGTYDHHVQEHRDGILTITPDMAHGGPAFYPWHRECLRRFEEQLRAVDPSVTLPYWDPVVDNSPTSSLWAPNFMGGNGERRHLRGQDRPLRLLHRGMDAKREGHQAPAPLPEARLRGEGCDAAFEYDGKRDP